MAATDENHFDRWHLRRCEKEVLSVDLVHRRGRAIAVRTAGPF